MGPDGLAAWEVILQSDVAISLLLLGAVLVLAAVLLGWTRQLHRENQQLQRELIEHLKAESDLNLVRLSRLLDLFNQHGDDRLDSTENRAAPAEPPRG